MEIEFPYREEESDIFELVKRPRVKIKVFSKLVNDWVTIDEVLADTGADFCVLPRYIGETLVQDMVQDITEGNNRGQVYRNQRRCPRCKADRIYPQFKDRNW